MLEQRPGDAKQQRIQLLQEARRGLVLQANASSDPLARAMAYVKIQEIDAELAKFDAGWR